MAFYRTDRVELLMETKVENFRFCRGFIDERETEKERRLGTGSIQFRFCQGVSETGKIREEASKTKLDVVVPVTAVAEDKNLGFK